MTPINAIILCDNKKTTLFLKKFEQENAMIIEIIGEADSFSEAMILIRSTRPNLILLDTEVIDSSFFEALKQLEFSTPKLVFISAYKDYAVTAFKHDAIDFLLKPIDFNSIMLAIYKVIKRREMEISYQHQKVNNVNPLNTAHPSNDYLPIASLEKIELIAMSDIIFCKAEGKYTVFVLGNGKKIMSSRNMGEYSSILDSRFFFRIHHSYIINLRHVTKISKKDGYFCELSNGAIIPVAKRRQDDFNKFIKLKE